MSWKASAYIKQLVVCPNGERISRTEKLVALVLADSHQDKGRSFTFPSVRAIAEDSLMDPRVCRRMLAALERKGVIERQRAENQGRGQLTFYRFPALDGEREKGGQDFPLSGLKKEDIASSLFLAERRTEGGRKEDKTAPPSYGVTGTGTNTSTTPPTPSRGEGERARKAAPAMAEAGLPLDVAVDQVCSAIGIANRRKRKLLRAVIELEAEKGEPPPTIALAMIAAWNLQAVESENLRCKYGLEKFFGDGYWKNSARWHWDEERLRLRREARAGSY